MILACEELFWLNIDIASRGFAGNVCSQIYVHRKFQIKRQPGSSMSSSSSRHVRYQIQWLTPIDHSTTKLVVVVVIVIVLLVVVVVEVVSVVVYLLVAEVLYVVAILWCQ